MTNLEQKVYDHISNFDAEDLVELWNAYCDHNNMWDSEIYYNDNEFLDTRFNRVSDFVRCADYGDYDSSHDWVRFDGYGNLESSDDVSDWVDYGELVEYAINDGGNLLDLWGIEDEEEEE